MNDKKNDDNNNNFFNKNPLLTFVIFSIVIIFVFKTLVGDPDSGLGNGMKSGAVQNKETTYSELKNMIKNKKGSIINIASTSGVCGNSGQANYSASKGGVIALSKTLAIEFGRYNIRVNALAPGIINSQMIEDLPNLKELKKTIPLKRFGEASEVAKCAYFIAVDATYISGEVINISGGMVR